ncbi:TRAUB-domain-containing protein [Basidiobolus meristosporus CBS 931.73]|uniref:Protein BFR2 n=1 Tax=Basidiobolus meristosporus CBS 931.73 TaxID=1314790 RepID=A0A1Y1Y4Q6_9FUNG|nr:TRAUB-domain-containing protein [Basidiobolus meristosporus CBS 931.73]|eukprot:ORX93000.1 TRAUB-domain-containing protein [Basidiobolus meristosporus CBS 931.73]
MPSKRTVKRTLGEKLADLANPRPKDLDPENYDFATGDQQANSDSEISDISEDEASREHYVKVGQSKLRNQNFVLNDPKYAGKRSSRSTLFDDEAEEEGDDDGEEEEDEEEEGEEEVAVDSDDDFGSDPLPEDEELEFDDSDLGESQDGSEQDSEALEDTSSEEDEEVDDYEQDEKLQEELQKIQEDEKSLLKNITQSAKSDVEKGQHVKNQLHIWEGLLDLRIRIQKSINSANKLPQHDIYPEFCTPESNLAVEEAKTEVRELMDSLLDIRTSLYERNPMIEFKPSEFQNRKRALESEDDDYALALWKDIDGINRKMVSYRDETLEKWSNKVQIASGIPLNKKFKSLNQGIMQQVNQLLSDRERLRGEYNILGKEEEKTEVKEELLPEELKELSNKDEHLSNHDSEVFDDTDFYQQLLRELIESKMVDSNDPVALGMRWAAIKQTKQKKKKVDTRASKGRKLRYHVHEKLQGFMVPIPTGTWHEEMVDELYASLLGRRVAPTSMENDEENEVEPTNDGLKIFG